MLIVTEAARQRLAQMLDEIQAAEETAVRLALVRDGAIATEPDIQRRGDFVFGYAGRAVLILDEEAQAVLADQVLYLDDIEHELDLAPQCSAGAPREARGDSAHASDPDQGRQDARSTESNADGMLWGRVRLEEDSDAVYH